MFDCSEVWKVSCRRVGEPVGGRWNGSPVRRDCGGRPCVASIGGRVRGGRWESVMRDFISRRVCFRHVLLLLGTCAPGVLDDVAHGPRHDPGGPHRAVGCRLVLRRGLRAISGCASFSRCLAQWSRGAASWLPFPARPLTTRYQSFEHAKRLMCRLPSLSPSSQLGCKRDRLFEIMLLVVAAARCCGSFAMDMVAMPMWLSICFPTCMHARHAMKERRIRHTSRARVNDL